jgi:hypothetical protein
MITELQRVISNVSFTQLALESLRNKDTARALELLELGLDGSVISLSILVKEAALVDGEQVTAILRRIRDYRIAHPRRKEADLGDLASGLLVRAGQLGEKKAREILEEIEPDAGGSR